MKRTTKSEASLTCSTVTEEQAAMTNVIQLNVNESGKRGHIRSKSGYLWEYKGNGPICIERAKASKYSKEKRNEDNNRVKRSYRLTDG